MDKDRFFLAGALPPSAAVNWSSPATSWDHSGNHSAHFESALSSLVSFPTSDKNNPAASAAAAAVDNFAIRELIGRLGTICSSETNHNNNSNSASCYATPMNSPPKLNLFSSSFSGMENFVTPGTSLMPVPPDPGFAERAARLSCFTGSGNYGSLLEPGKLSRVSSSRSLRAGVSNEFQAREGIGTRPSTPAEEELSSMPEESSVSDPGSAGEGNARKRKANAKGKGKEFGSSATVKENAKMEEDDNLNMKRSRAADGGNNVKNAGEAKTEQNGGQKKGKESDAKPPETPKQDYIHVRARRGQATDRHSLAERVRREKISERMKLLQDLVPGCNKIIGKAVMLDEIINYVQSLQRQVEFLSMKLATLNPHVDFSMENLHMKDINQACGPVSNPMQLLETPNAPRFQYPFQLQQGAPVRTGEATVVESQCSVNQLGFALPRCLSMQLASLEGFPESASQHGSFMESDLQSFVQMGYGQNQDISLSSQNIGQLPTGHTKLELS